MGRPPVIPAEKKIRIVLSILAGEMSLAEAARREKVSEQSIGRWNVDFLEVSNGALIAGKGGDSHTLEIYAARWCSCARETARAPANCSSAPDILGIEQSVETLGISMTEDHRLFEGHANDL